MVDTTKDESLENKDQEKLNEQNNTTDVNNDAVESIENDATDNSGDNEEPQTTAQSVNSSSPVVKLEDEIKKSFIDYAMSVIVDRALPDVRDGLKPVHRRVLYDMYDLKIWHNSQTKKSARVVGDVIGRFHPHGDAAVYETIVRMAQWFSLRAPLIFGQGNFGNIDGDGAAAMRYTEVRMTKIAEAMLQDIDKETVDTYPNYDGNEQIPEVLPTRFPNLLVNGSSGIAVGMATNIPPHNLGEVVQGTIALLDNPDISLDELMKYIPGPDFPTGGYIVGNAGIKEAYATGRGRCIMRARTHVEEDKSGRKTIYVDEIPYVVTKSSIVKQIAELVRDKKIEGISEVNDLSDKDNLVRIAIDLKRDAYEEAVLNNLFEKTLLQTSFAINMIALVNNHPRLLSLKDILTEFISFRREVVTRRTVYLLRQDRRKAFLNEGYIVAKSNINRVVEIITNSQNSDDAKSKLMLEPWDGALISSLIVRAEDGSNICLPSGIAQNAGLHDGKYYLSEEQATAILAMQLSRLTHLASDEIQDAYKGLIENIKGYLEILNKPERMKEVIREELVEVARDYSDKRRSDFIVDYGKVTKGDLIAKQDVVVTLSKQGYVKYQDIAIYHAQSRGGKGRSVAKLKDDDFISKILVTNTHDALLCFTDKGRAFTCKVYDLPTSETATWRGRPIQNIFDIEEDEKITALLSISEDEFDDSHFVIFATRNGLVKRTKLSLYAAFLKRSSSIGMKVMNLLDGDELIGAEVSSGEDDIFLFTNKHKGCHMIEEYQVSGSDSSDDETDESDSTQETQETVEVDDTDTDDSADIDENLEDKDQDGESEDTVYTYPRVGSGIRPSGRTAGGVKGIKLLNGAKVVSLIVVNRFKNPNPQIMIATENGFAKRMLINAIPIKNRGTQGNFIMRATERTGDVIGVTLIDDKSDFMLITDQGQLIRSSCSSIRLFSRYAAGVIAMRPCDGDRVIALQRIEADAVEAANERAAGRNLDKKDQNELESLLSGEKNDLTSDNLDTENNLQTSENTDNEQDKEI